MLDIPKIMPSGFSISLCLRLFYTNVGLNLILKLPLGSFGVITFIFFNPCNLLDIFIRLDFVDCSGVLRSFVFKGYNQELVNWKKSMLGFNNSEHSMNANQNSANMKNKVTPVVQSFQKNHKPPLITKVYED